MQTPATITPISLGTTAYTQDFNTLATTGTSSSVPAGFGFVETNASTSSPANSTYTAITITATASPNAGDTYSFGFGASDATDRAFGSLRSGALAPQFGFAFTNTTGATITSLAIEYTGEVYRLTGSATPRNASDRLDFQYSTNATSLTTGTFVDENTLDYAGPVNSNTAATGYDGNDPANRTAVAGTITGLSVAAGATFYIRFVDFDAPGGDDGLAIDDFSITATNAPACNAAFAYAASSFCASGTNPTATVTGTTGGTFSSTAGLSLDATTGAINLAASTAGTYTVTYTVSAGCSSTATVTVTAPATADFSYTGAANYCTSNTAAITPILSMGATAGTFSSTTGLTLDATTGAITPSSSTPGTYTVTNTVAASGSCAAVTSTTTVTISDVPTATLTAGSATTFCQGSSVVLSAPTGTGLTYQFALNGTAISGATAAAYTATAAGAYTVTVTNAAGCTATSAATTVTVNPATSAAFTYGAASYCASGTNPAATVTGTAGGTFSSTTGLSLDATTGTVNLAASTAGTYTVTYAVGGTCPSSATATLTITAPATAGFSYAAASFCASQTATATVTLATGASTGTFSSTAGLTLDAATGAINPATSTPGTYTVTNTVAAAGGCAAATATASVTITTAPVATFSYAPAGICVSQIATVAPVFGTGASAGVFSSTTGLSLDATTGAITASTSTPGTYVVTNTIAAAGGCAAATATFSVTINARPTQPTVAPTYNGATTTLTSSGTTGNQWFLNGVAIAGATNQTYVVNSAAQFGQYTVVVTDTPSGCPSLASAPLIVSSSVKPLAGSSLSVYPNPITDGNVTVELSGYAKATELRVYNALGQQVLERTLTGKPGVQTAPLDLRQLPAGVYVLRARTEGGLDVRRITKQ